MHDANMVQMFSSRLIANLAEITRESYETKKSFGTTVKTLYEQNKD